MLPTEIQAVLAWSALPHVGERTLQALFDHARESRQSLAELWTAPVEDLRALLPLQPRSAEALAHGAAERWRRAEIDLQELRSWGADLLRAGEPELPAELDSREPGRRRWPFLFAYGALGLLEEPRVAVVSSRGVSHSALAATDAIADALARRDVPLLTSINRESYQASATAAKRHAAPTVMVLDRGIREACPAGVEREPVATARVWDEALDPELQLLLSPFAWRQPWNPRSGPRRDALIFDLASVVVAVDLRPGGTMATECLQAAGRGIPVLALDRGEETPPGTSSLWEQNPAVSRVRWRGADDLVGQVQRLLPSDAGVESDQRLRDGWTRELGRFLSRAAERLSPRSHRAPVFAIYPATGPLAKLLEPSRPVAAGAAPDCLLADLALSGPQPATRPSQLLERVARDGLLAAVVPSAWLEESAHAEARSGWLQSARLRLAARLPQPIHADPAGPALAAVVLERGGAGERPALTFAPDRDRMGRFHLRRYLQEVLAALSG
ncbi:MAG: DNA-processing protein DprA [Armatimonadota bacterium]